MPRTVRARDAWERTGLVARAVFKTVEAFARGLVGSIPTRSRHDRSLVPRLLLYRIKIPFLNLRCQSVLFRSTRNLVDRLKPDLGSRS